MEPWSPSVRGFAKLMMLKLMKEKEKEKEKVAAQLMQETLFREKVASVRRAFAKRILQENVAQKVQACKRPRPPSTAPPTHLAFHLLRPARSGFAPGETPTFQAVRDPGSGETPGETPGRARPRPSKQCKKETREKPRPRPSNQCSSR